MAFLDKSNRESRRTEKTESAYLTERKRIQAANDEKTTRLRALRLAKEAVEREAAAKAAAEEALNPKPKKKKRAAAPAVVADAT